ncbi:MAG TPA: aldehyde dehydrogenase family protein [Verrucomicrobiota bacterium]|nr:aldehyde dehydrogenase family protein [Verrucomicrobiota bacterium]
MTRYSLFLNGTFVPAVSGRTFTTQNPADIRETVAEYALGGAPDAVAAFTAARNAFPKWAAMTPVARGRILSKASQLLEAKKVALAELLVREEGKTLAEATGEVQRAVDIFRFHGGLSYTYGGQTLPHELPNNLLYTRREPLGVVALITPWNFPIAIPAWKMAPALVCGNTVVIKPASATPAMTFELAQALHDAGLPPGVLNVITSDGRSFGAEVAQNGSIQALSFTGSYAVGNQLYQGVAPRMIRCQLEMGSKNPTLVLADADLDLAAKLVAIAGFGLTGQACTATSRVIVERGVLTAFTDKLVALARNWKVGPGLAPGVQMGPAVNELELQGNLDAIVQAKNEGAELCWGGERLFDGEFAHGWFMQPAVLGKVTPQMRIAQTEVFGPVVAVIAVDSFDEAVTVANGVPYGLSASLVTRDFKKAMQYADRIECGVVKVNQISTGLQLQAPFGGVKQSSTDTFREQGAASLDFYSRSKTIYLDYSA